jgi:hypothetical protein
VHRKPGYHHSHHGTHRGVHGLHHPFVHIGHGDGPVNRNLTWRVPSVF